MPKYKGFTCFGCVHIFLTLLFVLFLGYLYGYSPTYGVTPHSYPHSGCRRGQRVAKLGMKKRARSRIRKNLTYSLEKTHLFHLTDSLQELYTSSYRKQDFPLIFFLANNKRMDTLWNSTLFRFFDTSKPYPINIIDKKFKSGFGVIFDDILAGIYTAVIILIPLIYSFF